MYLKILFLFVFGLFNYSLNFAQSDTLDINQEIYEAAKNDNLHKLNFLYKKKECLLKIDKFEKLNNKVLAKKYKRHLITIESDYNSNEKPLVKEDLKYKEKKISFTFSPAFSFPHISNTNGLNTVLVFSINNNFAIDYRINKKIALGVNYKYSFSSGKNNYNYVRDYNALERHQFNSNTLNIFVKIFAPKNNFSSGVYFKPAIGFQLLSIKNVAHLYDPYGAKYFSMYSDKRFDLVGNFSVGKNWTIKNTLLLGFEVKSGLAFGSIVNTALINNTYHYREKTYANRYNIPTELLQIGFNIGFLAF